MLALKSNQSFLCSQVFNVKKIEPMNENSDRIFFTGWNNAINLPLRFYDIHTFVFIVLFLTSSHHNKVHVVFFTLQFNNARHSFIIFTMFNITNEHIL